MSERTDLPTFLSCLPVSADVKERLAELGTEGPVDLLGMIRAAHGDFVRLIGAEPLGKVVEALEAMTTPEERAVLETTPPRLSLGARTEPPPTRG